MYHVVMVMVNLGALLVFLGIPTFANSFREKDTQEISGF
jgi:hypothetical protein